MNKLLNKNRALLFCIFSILTTVPLAIYFFAKGEIGSLILWVTFLALIVYTYETRGMKNEMITQTELELKPIPIMYIRDINNYSEDKKRKLRQYCIETELTSVSKKLDESGSFGTGEMEKEFRKYLIRIKNVGNGPIFNLGINSKDYEVLKYQSQFFAPEPRGDEQSIKIARKDGKEIMSKYENLNGVIFEVSCENVNGKIYKFNYQIIDIEKQEVKHLS